MPPNPDLFQQALIASYVDGELFVPRPWLAERIEAALAQTNCRFVLLTGEPGAGKTAFMAELARAHPEWARVFIRRDSQTPLASGDAHAFLLAVGHQLAALRPRLFRPQKMEVVIRQRVREIKSGGRLVGVTVEDLYASPFYQSSVAFQVEQDVTVAAGQQEGVTIKRVISDPHLLDVEKLQFLALFGPAQVLLAEAPEARIVILVDALDELRQYRGEQSILNWLAGCPELPPNVRFVLTSRPDPLLSLLRGRQGVWLVEQRIDPAAEQVQNDLRRFAATAIARPAVTEGLVETEPESAAVVEALAGKAAGNFQYLVTVQRAIKEALARGDRAQAQRLLQLQDLPDELEELYAFFLHQVKASCENQTVAIEDAATGDVHYVPTWSAVYDPLLGALSAAREPLPAEQLQRFGRIQARWADITGALGNLRQFYDEQNGRYRFFHATLPEFLTSADTRQHPERQDLYQEPALGHRRIYFSYRDRVGGWETADWDALDAYGWRHLLAHAEAAGDGRVEDPGWVQDPPLQVGDAGFLAAKLGVATSLVELEADWQRLFRACRRAGAWERAVRYGFARVAQFGEVAYLINAATSTAVARLVVRQGERAAVTRLAEETALIPQTRSRLNAQLALLETLLKQMPDHPAVPALADTLDEGLDRLPPGYDRDQYLLAYVPVLAVSGREGWQQTCREELARSHGLAVQSTLRVALAMGENNAGRPAESAAYMTQAVDACRNFDLREDDIVLDLLQLTGMGERTDNPQAALQSAVTLVVQALLRLAPHLEPEATGSLVASLREELSRLEEGTDALRLANLLVQALDRADLGRHAEDMARQLVSSILTSEADDEALAWMDSDAYASRAAELAGIMPLVARMDEETLWATWWQQFGRALGGIEEAADWRWLTAVCVTTLPEQMGRTRFAAVLGRLHVQIETAQVTQEPASSFAVLATLAAAYIEAGEPDRARRLLEQILQGVSVANMDVYQPNERRAGMFWMWSAACRLADADLLQQTLAWLQATMPAVLASADRVQLWSGIAGALGEMADAHLALGLMEQIKPYLAGAMETGGYVATAWLQLAEAYNGLEEQAAAQRLALESSAVARASAPLEGWPPASYSRIMARAAGILAQQGVCAASAGLLDEALGPLPYLDAAGQAECLGLVLERLASLSRCTGTGMALAEERLDAVLAHTESIWPKEETIRTIAYAVNVCAASELAAPVERLAERARDYLEQGDEGQMAHAGAFGEIWIPYQRDKSDAALLQTVMGAIWALWQPHPEDARALLAGVETAVRDLLDAGGRQAPQAVAHLARLLADLNEQRSLTAWREQATAITTALEDDLDRLNAALAMVHLNAQIGDAGAAGIWLRAALAMWWQLEEWMVASRYIGQLVDAWAAVNSVEERLARLPALQEILEQVPAAGEREDWQARLAISFWDEPQQFAALFRTISGLGGLDPLLTALHEAEEVPPGLLPDLLYEIVEKASRQPVASLAGISLLATQVRVRRGISQPQQDKAVLALIEAQMRSFTAIPLIEAE